MELKPGKYIARPVDWGIGETQGGHPQAMVMFALVDQEGNRHERIWFGSFKEGKAREITIKALLNCGLKGNDLSLFAAGVEGAALDASQDVELTLEKEVDDQGVERLKIRWINRPGGAAFRNKLAPDQAKAKLATLNLGGDIMAMRQETGLKDQPRTPRPQLQQPGAPQNATPPAWVNEPGAAWDDEVGF